MTEKAIFENRIPDNPNRVLVTPESGTPFYATLSRADINDDNPDKQGTPVNKALFNKVSFVEDVEQIELKKEVINERKINSFVNSQRGVSSVFQTVVNNGYVYMFFDGLRYKAKLEDFQDNGGGIKWEISQTNLNGIVFVMASNTRFIAFSYNPTKIYYSDDFGLNWTDTGATPPSTSYAISDGLYYFNRFIVIGYNGRGYSDDGITWEFDSSNPSPGSTSGDRLYKKQDGNLYYFAAAASKAKPLVCQTTDGKTWTYEDVTVPSSLPAVSDDALLFSTVATSRWFAFDDNNTGYKVIISVPADGDTMLKYCYATGDSLSYAYYYKNMNVKGLLCGIALERENDVEYVLVFFRSSESAVRLINVYRCTWDDFIKNHDAIPLYVSYPEQDYVISGGVTGVRCFPLTDRLINNYSSYQNVYHKYNENTFFLLRNRINHGLVFEKNENGFKNAEYSFAEYGSYIGAGGGFLSIPYGIKKNNGDKKRPKLVFISCGSSSFYGLDGACTGVVVAPGKYPDALNYDMGEGTFTTYSNDLSIAGMLYNYVFVY